MGKPFSAFVDSFLSKCGGGYALKLLPKTSAVKQMHAENIREYVGCPPSYKAIEAYNCRGFRNYSLRSPMPIATSWCPVCEAPVSAENRYLGVAAIAADRELGKHMTSVHGRVLAKVILGLDSTPQAPETTDELD